MTSKSLLLENKDFWKLLLRNFAVSFRYMSDFLFGLFVEIECTVTTNEEIIRHNICNVELQPSIPDI